MPQTRASSDKIIKILGFESKQLIVLVLLFFCGGALYIPIPFVRDVLGVIYPFLIGLLVVRFVWRLVRIHSTSPSKGAGQSALDWHLMPRLGLALYNNVLFLVLAGYIMIAAAFAVAFHVTGMLKGGNTLGDCFYFSMTTLGTLGYGDIVPVGIGRWMTVGEILINLCYQVIVIGAAVNYFAKIQQDQN